MVEEPPAKSIDGGIAVIKPQFICSRSVDEPENKKPKFQENEGKKKQKGQNKKRHKKTGQPNEPQLCKAVLMNVAGGCVYPACKFSHNVEEYLEKKPADISDKCHVFETYGHCVRGVTCRFASGHKSNTEVTADLSYMKEDCLTREQLTLLRKKEYDFSKANAVVDSVWTKSKLKKVGQGAVENAEVECSSDALCDAGEQAEKRRIDWKGKLYLSPLTTLGNLPFRRICKEWGADITCGEMAMATSVLQGFPSEWALLRRHPSETIFGVQLCGNNPHVLARSCQLVEEIGVADFIDLNLGCPIDLVYKKGSGCGLLRNERNLDNVVRSMVLSTNLPVTVKTRTGIYNDKLVAHKLMPLYTAAGVSLITVHGRTRELRYTRHADWGYVDECAKLAKPVPVFGNGDILSYEDYNHALSQHQNISGAMIGRGALYKPWLFTEIKEQRHWDISSSERLDNLKKFVNYGFEHWGSDTKGVETTRRFLLEWLSFLYRYIPVGLLEHVPQKINERPPRYFGRDDLETLMASPNSADWVKISEMLCGPVPDDFHFLPKHKANSWA